MADQPVKTPNSPWLAALIDYISLALLGTIIFQLAIALLVRYSGMKPEEVTDMLIGIQSMAIGGVIFGWIFLVNLKKDDKVFNWAVASVAMLAALISLLVGANQTMQDLIIVWLCLLWVGTFFWKVTRLSSPLTRLLTLTNRLSKGSKSDLFAARKVLEAIAEAKRGTPPDLYKSIGELEEEIYHTILNLVKFLESIDQLIDYCTASIHDKAPEEQGKTAKQRAQSLLGELQGKVNRTLELLREVQGWVVITCTEAKAQSQVGGDFSEKVAEIRQQLKFQFEAMEEINQKLGE